MEALKQGRIEYDISIIVPDNAPEIQQYSRELWLRILQYNIPATKEILFNGKFSRTTCMSTDYGYKSNTIILRKAGSKKYQYGKEFPYFNFYLDQEEHEPVPAEYFPTRVELLNEYKEIAGYKCRKAKIESLSKVFIIYFTEAFKVNDPTGAVLQHEGINGFVMQQDEIPVAGNIYHFLRYTVKEIDFSTAAPATVFNIPDGFIHFRNLDEVRKENRKRMLDDSQNVWKQNPLSDTQKNMYNGYWLLDDEKSKIIVHVEYAGSGQQRENKYIFTTKEISVKNPMPPKVTIEQASLWKFFLLVEEPPNYRLYAYNAEHDSIELKENNSFVFKKTNEEDIKHLLV